jgi:hypothetical protein
VLDSILRTAVPYLVGCLIVLAAKVGLDLHPDMTLTEVVTLVVATGYYALARLLEQWWPNLGKVLLSGGLASGGQPVYAKVIQGRTERLPRA